MSIEIDTRDRVIRVETEVKNLKKDIESMSEKLNEMHIIFTQAKGARAIIIIGASIAGFVAAWLPSLYSFLTK